MINSERDVTYFGKTNSRGKEVEFGIRNKDRLKHMYIIGKTGMGKSTLLENMAVQDIKKGNGLAFFDPHGSAIETFLDYIPEERIKDVVYFAPFDVDYPIAFNPLENTDPTKRYLTAQGLMAAFKKIFGEESFSDRMQHMTNNTLLALLEYPGATLLHITRMLSDDAFRDDVIEYITDPSVKAYWTNEFNMWDEKFRREASAAVLNKIGQFTTNPLIRNIIGQEKSTFDFREIIDEGKVLLVNLSKGQIGEDNANLLGAMLTTKLYLAAMSRADKTKAEIDKLPPFYLYIDEFQNLANDSFANILAEARKYKLSLILAHQYMEQMPDIIRAAVFGNIGTMISFQIGAIDAEILEQQFMPIFTAEDFTNLGFTEIYLRMAIDGITSPPFSAITLPPIQKPEINFVDEVIESSRKKYAMDRVIAEKKINDWILKKYTDKKAIANLEEKLAWEREKYFKYGAKKYEANEDVIKLAKEMLGFTSFEDEKNGVQKIKDVVVKKTEKIVEKTSESIEKTRNILNKDLSFEAFKKTKNELKVEKESVLDRTIYLSDDEKFILEMQKKDGFLPKDFQPSVKLNDGSEIPKEIVGKVITDEIEEKEIKTEFKIKKREIKNEKDKKLSDKKSDRRVSEKVKKAFKKKEYFNKSEEKTFSKEGKKSYLKKVKKKDSFREKEKTDKHDGGKKDFAKQNPPKENPFKSAFKNISLKDSHKKNIKEEKVFIKKESQSQNKNVKKDDLKDFLKNLKTE